MANNQLAAMEMEMREQHNELAKTQMEKQEMAQRVANDEGELELTKGNGENNLGEYSQM
jgi:hypothetical protein